MNGWWMLANLVLAAHILLFVLLALGVVLAAARWVRLTAIRRPTKTQRP